MSPYSRSQALKDIAKLPETDYNSISTLLIEKENQTMGEDVHKLYAQIHKVFIYYDPLRDRGAIIDELKRILTSNHMAGKGCINDKLKTDNGNEELLNAAIIHISRSG